MSELTVNLKSLADTAHLGSVLAKLLRPGDVVALIGGLGAGKTHLSQAIAAGFGVSPEEVTSPTFVLIQEYDAFVPICHIDAYRLKDIDEFLELGADELLGAENICLIEWADRVQDVLPQNRITVKIESTGLTERQVTICCPDSRFEDFEHTLSAAFESVRRNG